MLDVHLRFLFGLAPDGLQKSPLVRDSWANPVIALCRPRRRGRLSAFMFGAHPVILSGAFAGSTIYLAGNLPGGAFTPGALATILGWFVIFALITSYPVAYFSVLWFAVWRPRRDWLDELASTPLRRGEVALAHYVWGLSAAVRVMSAVAFAFLAIFLTLGIITSAHALRRGGDLALLSMVAGFAGPLLLYVAAVVPLALDKAVVDVARRGDSKWGWMNLFFLDWGLHVAQCAGFLGAILILAFLCASVVDGFVGLLGKYLVLLAAGLSAFLCWLAVGPVMEVVAMRLAEHRHREITDLFWELNEE